MRLRELFFEDCSLLLLSVCYFVALLIFAIMSCYLVDSRTIMLTYVVVFSIQRTFSHNLKRTMSSANHPQQRSISRTDHSLPLAF